VIQLYGHLHSYDSFSNITRALGRELRRHRVEAQVYPVGDRELAVIDNPLPVGLDNTARVGVCIGYPEAAVGWLAGHPHRVLMTVCESNRIPETWVAACNTVNQVLVPSSWCKAAFLESGVRTPVDVVPHGLWPVDRSVLRGAGEVVVPTFLHVSGSLSFSARKGTAPLLRAFRAFVDDHLDARLVLKVPHTQGLMNALRAIDLTRHVDVLPNETLPPEAMALLLANVTAVVQPSRAEGFGLVPLEARYAGTPVVVTHCTGHTEHAHKDDVVVAHGSLAPVETQANPVGEAPTVSADAVKAALDRCWGSLYTLRQRSLENARQRQFDGFLWERVLAPLVTYLKQHDEHGHIRLGGRAGLRGTS
jgi:glycosyltransferase involved in cell wall biosynthesis